MRKILGTKKVGHTGTLDPQATGVLPVCVGKGTKVSDMLTNSDKEYVARVTLGITTDTEDIWGEVIEKKDCSHITSDMICRVCESFVGEIEQVPPMYSAVKIGGKKLYEYARSGVEIERKSRKVTIHKITVEDFADGEFTMRVSCSKGTYIRTLCSDIGKKLGVGACMSALIRTKSSVFTLDMAKTIDEVRQVADSGEVEGLIIPVDELFKEFNEIRLDADRTAKILNGMFLNVPHPDGEYRVYSNKSEFICIGRVLDNTLRIVKNFYAN